MTPEAIIARGERAKAILSDPIVVEVLEHLRNEMRELFFSLPTGDAKARDQLVHMDKARQNFERCLVLLIDGGKVEKDQLLADEEAKSSLQAIQQRIRGWVGQR